MIGPRQKTSRAPMKDDYAGKAKVLLIDDHPIVRQGLVQLINEEPDLVVCAEASSARAQCS